MDRLGMSRSEILKTPTYERRYYLGLLRSTMDAPDDEVQVTKKGDKQITTYSGEALKAKLKNDEIRN